MFLEFKFHDNDFGNDAKEALDKLWQLVSGDISAHSHSANRTASEVFVYLHGTGLLKQMIKKLMVLSATAHDIEWATRGLHKKGAAFFHDKIDPVSKDVARFEKYFDDIEIELHKTKKFSGEWMNSEHAWLDLDTGDIGLF